MRDAQLCHCFSAVQRVGHRTRNSLPHQAMDWLRQSCRQMCNALFITALPAGVICFDGNFYFRQANEIYRVISNQSALSSLIKDRRFQISPSH